MRPKSLYTACLTLALCLAGPALAQMMPGMPGGFGPAGGMEMGMGGMPGMGGMGAQAQSAPKWVSPLVPLCWSVGRSQYPGIACLYATPGQRAELEALIREVSSDIEGRFWIKFADVTADSDPPSFIREVLDPEFRRGKGSAAGAATGAGGIEGGMAGMAGGMGGMEAGGGMGGAQATQTDTDMLRAAQKACPAIVIFGKDLFSQPKAAAGAAAGAGAAGTPGGMAPGGGMEMGMMGGAMGMPGMGAAGGMGAQTAQDTMWAKMDHNFMIYWSFVGRKEKPTAEILRFVLGAVGDPDNGINRWALRLKLSKENVGTTMRLAKAYVGALEDGRKLLPRLQLGQDPTRGRIVQQNQYMADYLLARALTLTEDDEGDPRPGTDQARQEVRKEQRKLLPSFRYAAPTPLTPLLSEDYPGLVGFYRDPAERRTLEEVLDAVDETTKDGNYWVKLIEVMDEDKAKDEDLFVMLRTKDNTLDVEIESFPALVLCGQDIFLRDKEEVVALAGGTATGTGQTGGMEMGGMGMGEMGMAGGAGAGAGAAQRQDMKKPTDWLIGGGAAAGAAAGGMGAAGGAEAGGMAPGGGMEMGMMGGMMGGEGGAMGAAGAGGAGLSTGGVNWSDYDYRMPDRTARLMQYWLFEGNRQHNPMPPPSAPDELVDKLKNAKVVDDTSRVLKNDQGHDDVGTIVAVGRAYTELKKHYMADYFLARATKFIEKKRDKIRDTEERMGEDAWVNDEGKDAHETDYERRLTELARYEKDVRDLRRELLVYFYGEEATTQMPVLLTAYPGIVIYYKGDEVHDPEYKKCPKMIPKPTDPSKQRDELERIMAQPALRDYIRDKYWVKWVRVEEKLGPRRQGLDERPELLTALPAALLISADMFSEDQVVGGNGSDPEEGAPAAGAAGMGAEGMMGGGPGMGMGGGMGGYGGAMTGMGGTMGGALEAGGMGTQAAGGGDPAGWLPPGGTGTSAAGTGMGAGGAEMGGGGMMGMEAGGAMGAGPGAMGGGPGGMGGTAGTREPDEDPIPIGIVQGLTQTGQQFCQWVDYEHWHQMGDHQGYTMVDLSFVGKDELPVPPPAPSAAEGMSSAQRQQAKHILHDLGWHVWQGDSSKATGSLREFVRLVAQDPAAVDAASPDAQKVAAVKQTLTEGLGWTDDRGTQEFASLLVKCEGLQSPNAKRQEFFTETLKWVRVEIPWRVGELLRQLRTVWDIDWFARAAHDEYKEFEIAEKRPSAQNAFKLARAYVALPAPHMAEYMLARTDYLLEEGWEADNATVRKAAERALEQQARGPNHTGGQELPELYNFLKDDPLEGPFREAWLAAMTAARREGVLPLFFVSQYVTSSKPSAPATAYIASTSLTPTSAQSTGTRTELNLGQDVRAVFQQPPEQLSVEDLQRVRAAMLQAVGRHLSPDAAKAAWSRLIHVELELRQRRNAKGVDGSWTEIMKLWKDRHWMALDYAEEVVEALKEAMREDIRVLRAINVADVELQQAPRGAEAPPVEWGADQVATLRDYLKRRPNGQAAEQARYMLAVLLETSGRSSAAGEQFNVLKSMEGPPEWWRWGLARWENFKQF